MANANGGVIMKAERCPEGNEAATHNNSAREKICHISQNRCNTLTVNTIKAGRQALEWGIFQPQQNYLPASNKKRRTTDIHKISVVHLIIYSYSECLFLNSQAYFTSSKIIAAEYQRVMFVWYKYGCL
jgi:hypothetical protein